MDAKTASAAINLDGLLVGSGSDSWVLSTIKEHGAALVNMLWRILGREEDVCDAYQDTFLQLANCGERLKPINAKAYIFKTASNTAISIIRRRQMDERFKKNLAVDIALKSGEEVENDFDAGHVREELRKYMAELPEMLRDVLVMHDLGGMQYEQVAGILGLTSGTVRVYRFKAVQLLALWMGKKNE